MTKGEISDVFDCSMKQFYSVISDYPRYPEFLAEVKSCNIIQAEGNRKLVEYEISVIKSFKYRLWMLEENDHTLTWEFASGDLFKHTSGAWVLKDEAGKTRATYHIEAQFNIFVPGPVAKAMIKVNLPSMMSSYHRRISELSRS